MNIRLTQLDGKLPNLALMKLSHWHIAQGDEVYLSCSPERDYFNPDIVYGSAIFKFSEKLIERFKEVFPDALLGGTGIGNFDLTVEKVIGHEYEHYDYSIYPHYKWSLGFTQRGCRLACKWCVVRPKEGKARSVNSIYDIWRGEGHPRCIVLLDNDFFGQPREQWQARIAEIRDGNFKVNFNQGINIRLIDDEAAAALAMVKYYDDDFKVRRLHTAWDNLKDEKIFFEGVDRLERAGILPKHLMTYMLIGFDPEETWERIFYRFNKMVKRGIKPYPMVYNNADPELKVFQRWVIRRYYEFIKWEEFQKT